MNTRNGKLRKMVKTRIQNEDTKGDAGFLWYANHPDLDEYWARTKASILEIISAVESNESPMKAKPLIEVLNSSILAEYGNCDRLMEVLIKPTNQ